MNIVPVLFAVPAAEAQLTQTIPSSFRRLNLVAALANDFQSAHICAPVYTLASKNKKLYVKARTFFKVILSVFHSSARALHRSAP